MDGDRWEENCPSVGVEGESAPTEGEQGRCQRKLLSRQSQTRHGTFECFVKCSSSKAPQLIFLPDARTQREWRATHPSSPRLCTLEVIISCLSSEWSITGISSKRNVGPFEVASWASESDADRAHLTQRPALWVYFSLDRTSRAIPFDWGMVIGLVSQVGRVQPKGCSDLTT